MINKFIFYVFLLGSLLFSTESMIGRIHSVSGEVTIYSSTKTNSERKAIIGRAIYDGDRIATSNNGICQILFEDNDVFVRINENSKIKGKNIQINTISIMDLNNHLNISDDYFEFDLR